jgi:DNA-binding transcriptional ArsR family regulator
MARRTTAHRSPPAIRTTGVRAVPMTLEFDSRTAWDFVASIAIGDAPEHDLVEADREWLTNTRASLGEQGRATLDRLFGPSGMGIGDGLPMLVEEEPAVRTSADVMGFLDGLAPHVLVKALIEECLTGDAPEELIDRASIGDDGALIELEPSLCAPEAADVVRDFTADADASMRQLRQLGHAWLAAFEPIEERIGRIHANDIATRKADIASLPADQAIEAITGGIRILPEPRVRRMLLAPSVFMRPFNYVHQHADWRLICYPVSDEVIETDSGQPSGAMVRLFRALGDPTRLQVLRLLTERDWYLTELATKLELSKPTMKHHLALLRAAGLVTVIQEGALTYYRIRRERLSEGGSELRRYLA